VSEIQKTPNPELGTVSATPRLVLYGSDVALLERLKPYSTELPYIAYETGYGPQATARAHLDAVWVNLMGAVELFGATPPFPLHEAQILRTPAAQLAKGFPRYGIAGVAVSQDDPNSPEFVVRLVMSALVKTVRDFNSVNQHDLILRIGILPDDLGLRKIKPDVVFQIVREAYETS